MDAAETTAIDPPDRAPPRAALRENRLWLFLCVASLAALPYVLLTAVTGFSWFDDEGTLMAFIRSVLDGHRLYDETFSLYGPFYHLVYDFIYGDLGVPLDNLSARLLAAGFWLAFTACFAAFAIRLSGSLIVGTFSYLLVISRTAATLNSPGHPEELALLLLGVLLLAIAAAEQRMRVSTLVAIGALLAAQALVKINLGAFVGGAVVIALLRTTIQPGWLRAALAILAVGMLLLPAALFSLLFAFPWVRSYCLFATLTILPAIVVWIAGDQPRIMPRAMWWPIVAGGALATAAIVGVAMAQGSSLAAIVRVVLLQNADYARRWYIPLDIPWLGLLVAVASAVCGLGYALSAQRRVAVEPARNGIMLLKLSVGLLGCLPLMTSQLRFELIMPFAWLVMIPPRGVVHPLPVARGAAGLIGSAMVLYPFPVAGHQVDLAMVPLLLLAPVLLWDVITEARLLGWLPWLTADYGRRLGAIAAAAAVAFFAVHTWRAARLYASGEPLDMPGTAFIRIDPQQAETYRWIGNQVADCPAMFWLPEFYSMSLWTGHGLLTPLNITNPLGLISTAGQDRIVAALSAQPRLCVVYEPDFLQRLDRGQMATNPPLLRYILGNFSTIAEHDGFQIMKRRGT
jgi:hypothetical protein